jgi:N-carbamoyl-L-amino-acid hydrolase
MIDLVAALDGEELLTDLEALGQIGRTANGGLMRLAFSPADLQGRAWVRQRMASAGLTVQIDAAGNSLGWLAGADPTLPPIVLGSHTDTVPDGGRFDGALGVLAALSVVRTLRAAGSTTRHPLVVIDFSAEEATVPGGTFGSRALTGQLHPSTLTMAAWSGAPLADLLRQAAINPDSLATAVWQPGSIAAYFELHIEQGGQLAAASLPIGVVEGIVGIRRYVASFQGDANHAGTTPMAERNDALVRAAPLIGAVQQIAMAHEIVGTVGTIHVSPNAANVIPGQVQLGIEMRGLAEGVLDAAEAALREATALRGGILDRQGAKAPVPCDPQLMAVIEQSCHELGIACRRMPSGAGHDAMCMAGLGPMAMIFVPSIGGVSHAPTEATSASDCVTGARVLLRSVLAVDAHGGNYEV